MINWKLLIWNLEGLENKWRYVNNLLQEEKPDILLAQEHWARRKQRFNNYDTTQSWADESEVRNKNGLLEAVRQGTWPTVQTQEDQKQENIRYRKLWWSLDGTNYVMFQVYGPQASKKDEVKAFYHRLQEEFNNLPEGTIILVVGDFNAWLGDGRENESTKDLKDFMKVNSLKRLEPHYQGGKQATCKSIQNENEGTSVVDHVLVSKAQEDKFKIKVSVVFQEKKLSKHAQLRVNITWKSEEATKSFPPAKPVKFWSKLSPKQAENYELNGKIMVNNWIKLREKRQNTTEMWEQFSAVLVKARNDAQTESTQSLGTNKNNNKNSTGYWKKRFWRHMTEELVTLEERSVLEELTEDGQNEEKIEDQEHKLETEQTLTRIVRKLIGSLKSNKNKMWAILKKMKGSRRETIPRMMYNKKGEKITSKPKYEELFHQALGRKGKGQEPKEEKHQQWRFEVEAAVKKWMEDTDKGWGPHRPTKEEIQTALREARKDSAPGDDKITVEMLTLLGQEGIEALYILLGEIWEKEEIPDQFLQNVIVPIYKKNSKYNPKNYRPISLMSVAAKLLQRLIYTRIDEYMKVEKNKCNGLSSKYSYGFCKGRDRMTALWLLEAATASENITQENGGKIFLMVQDVEDGFPSIWQDGVNYLMKSAGVTGKIWRISVLTEKNLTYKIRLNGHYTENRSHGHGANQGGVSPPHRFNVLINTLVKEETTKKEKHLTVDGKPLTILVYADDVQKFFSTSEQFYDWLHTREESADKWRYKWKLEKDKILIRGKQEKAGSHQWTVEEQTWENVEELELLGQFLTGKVGCSETHVKKTIQAMKAAVAGFNWILNTGAIDKSNLVSCLFESMVASIARSKLVLSRLTTEQWKRIETIKADVAKQILGVDRRASNWAVYGELGWNPLESSVQKAKLQFLGRLWRIKKTEDPVAYRMIQLRIKQVEQGDKQGLLGEMYELLQSTEQTGELWYGEGRNLSKDKWKDAVNEMVEEIEQKQWILWMKAKGDCNGWLTVTKRDRELETYVDQVRPGLLPLFSAIRLGITNAAADKTGDENAECRLCGKGRETIQHLLITCKNMEKDREIFWQNKRKPRVMSEQWAALVGDLQESVNFVTEVDRQFRRKTGVELAKKGHWKQSQKKEEDKMEEWVERGEMAELARFVMDKTT
jgi:hypothetical protein